MPKTKKNWSVRQGTDEEANRLNLPQMSLGSQTLRISERKRVILITHGHKGQTPYPTKEEKQKIIAAVEQLL